MADNEEVVGQIKTPRLPAAGASANLLPLTRILGISEEGLRTLRAEAQRTFDHHAGAEMSFYKTLGRPILVRIVAWYRGPSIEHPVSTRSCWPRPRHITRDSGPNSAKLLRKKSKTLLESKSIKAWLAAGWVFFWCTDMSLPLPKWLRMRSQNSQTRSPI